jgi:hypothetical protein
MPENYVLAHKAFLGPLAPSMPSGPYKAWPL